MVRPGEAEEVRCGTGPVVAIYSIINEHFNAKQFAVNVVVMVRMLLVVSLLHPLGATLCLTRIIYTSSFENVIL